MHRVFIIVLLVAGAVAACPPDCCVCVFLLLQLPAWPFAAASVFLGAYALIPYMCLWSPPRNPEKLPLPASELVSTSRQHIRHLIKQQQQQQQQRHQQQQQQQALQVLHVPAGSSIASTIVSEPSANGSRALAWQCSSFSWCWLQRSANMP